MLQYQLFFSVENRKNSYTETKCYLSKEEALKEALHLTICDNVKFVSIRMVNVKSIELEVYKKPLNCEIDSPYKDCTSPTLSENNVNISLCSNYTITSDNKTNYGVINAK